MAISQTMSNALSGLRAAMRGTEVSSSNIANAMTEGYGVRSLHLASRDLGGYGAGVNVVAVERGGDPFLVARRRLSDAEYGAQTETARAYKTLETLMGGYAEGDGLGDRLTAVETALSEASADPSSAARRERVVHRLQDLTDGINHVASGITRMREQADQKISDSVQMLNSSLGEIDRLNDEILRTQKGTGEVSGLYDQRQQLIDKISELVPVRQLSREGGRVALITTQGELLLDHRPREFGFVRATAMSPAMTFSNGALSGLTLDGDPVSGSGAAGNLSGGSIGALFEIRDKIAPSAQGKMDEFAADLMTRLSDPAMDDTLTAGDAGLVVAANPSDPNLPTGLATTLRVNPAILPDTGTSERLRDGLGSIAPGPAGDATRLNNWAEALSRGTYLTATSTTQKSAHHLNAITSSFVQNRVTEEDNLSRSTAMRESFMEREAAQGVDTDAEMQTMLRLEKAYAANAKVIQVVDTLMGRLLEI